MNAEDRNPANESGFTDDELRQLGEYLDGTLEADEAEQLERKLAEDASLQSEFEALRAIDRLVKSHQPPLPDLDWDAFAKGVQQRLPETHNVKFAPPPKRTATFWRPLAAAAVLAICVGGYTWLDRSPRAPQTGTLQTIASVQGVQVTIHRPTQRATAGRVVATVSREWMPTEDDDFEATMVGPPYQARTLLIATGI